MSIGHEDNYLDLHGLLLEEAMEFFVMRLNELTSLNKEVIFEVIPGAGHHSAGHTAVIKPHVIDEIRKRGFKYEEKSGGDLLVWINEGK